ncbi:MAG: hypothetical protein IJ756_00780 [Paludibacteraceae bacterium]|nr:hypothetical protein [Paludibacteraceae bacterium]
MTKEDYIELLQSPDSVMGEDIEALRALLTYAPYSASARILLLKALHRTNDIMWKTELPKTVMYARRPEDVYYILYPEKVTRKALQSSGDYFTFVSKMQQEADRQGTSFSELAEKFKKARQMRNS